MNRRILNLLFIILSFAIGNANADTAVSTEKQGWSGIAGVGPMTFSKYTGGTGTQTWLLPLISANYDEIVYIDPLRANVYLGSTSDKKMAWGLAVEPRMGFHASDGAKLAGMATRRNSLEGGFNFDWDADIIAIS
ncbi:MAG: MipA/OmpV family protein, partial [Burkholderiaceae bacterium]